MPENRSTSSKSSKPAASNRGKSAAAKPAPEKRAAPRRAAGTGAKRAGSPRAAGAAPRVRPPAKPRRPILTRISNDRKLDVAGTVIALLGLLTGLSLLSSSRGSLTGMWVGWLTGLVGWGVYLLPIALLAIGLWLVLRNVERLPQLALERVAGILLSYFGLLAVFHLLAGGGDSPAGGSAGAALGGGLAGALGRPGAWIVLLAWLIIGLAMSLDLSVPEIFRWLGPAFDRARAAVEQLASPRPARQDLTLDEPDYEGEALTDDYTPLRRTGTLTPTAGLDQTAPTLPAAGPRPAPANGTVTASSTTLIPQPPETDWKLPVLEEILDETTPAAAGGDLDSDRGRLIEETLRSFGAPGHIVEISRGPTITQFGLEPDFIETRSGRTRVRVSKIVALADDLALALAAQRIRIQAPVPGRAYVGIEVPNNEVARVGMLEVIKSEQFQKLRSPLRFTLGKDVSGKSVAADLAAMPHLLIAGTTGSGKSVCVNSILCSLLLNNTPDDVRLILVDPKRVELTGYNGIPHLLAPVVTDAERVVGALQWMMREMDNRYQKFAQVGARNIVDYNARLASRGEKRIPYLVVVIDELADLMMLAPDETERTITRLAQLARATGLHLILATQRPSVDVLTGLIKANFPARVAFAVASGVDSRVILDQPGAERLLGRGDMLFQAPDAPAPVRLQGVYVSDSEIQRTVMYWKTQIPIETAPAPSHTPAGGEEELPRGVPLKQTVLWEEEIQQKEAGDPMLAEATELVRREGRASISMLQRRLRVGYTRAARLIDTMEEKGIIGPALANSQVRTVLDYGQTAPPEED